MCINPRLLDNGALVPCRKCWQCKANRVNDWVGRCIAESQTCVGWSAITLTYGPDAEGNKNHIRTAVLTYSDVQKYFKLLRRHGYPLRYLVVGEFGSAKGRVHWHMVVFWQKKVPTHLVTDPKTGQEKHVPMPLRVRFNERHWPHGFSQWDTGNVQAIRYVCKYISKDMLDAERQQQVGLSKMPPLGAGYFRGLARRYVEQGISPRTPEYHFGDVRDKEGKPIRFRLRGASLDLFLAEFLRNWEEVHGGHPPASDLIGEYEDRIAPASLELRPAPFRALVERPWKAPPSGEPYFSEPHNAWACDVDGQTLFWSYDLQGDRAWQNVIRTEAQADRLREASVRRKASGSYRDQSRGT